MDSLRTLSLALAEHKKLTRVRRFAARINELRREVDTILASPAADRATAVAAIIRLMDTSNLRVGSES